MVTDWNAVYREQEEACEKVRAETIEECAKIAEARAARYKTSGGSARADEAREIAKDIRALSTDPGTVAVTSTNGNTP